VFFSLIAFRNGGSVDDYAVYEDIYKTLTENPHFVEWVEPFTQLEIAISNLLGWSVKGLYFLSALITAIFLGISLPYFIKKKSEFVIYWMGLSLLHYYSCTGLIVQVQCAAMLMYIVTLQLRGKTKLSFFLYIILCFVHSAALIMIPLWLLIEYRRKIFNQKRLKYAPYIFLFFCLLGGFKLLLLKFANLIPSNYSYIIEMIIDGENADKKGFLIFFCLSCYTLTLLRVKFKSVDGYKQAALIAVFVYLILYFASFGVLYLFRIAYYLLFFSPFCFAYIPLHKFEKKVLGIFMCAYFVFTMYHFDTYVISDYEGSLNLYQNYTSRPRE
jgi:hypothetical protein